MSHMAVATDKSEQQWCFGMWLTIVHKEEIRFIVNISWLGHVYKENGKLFRRLSVRTVDRLGQLSLVCTVSISILTMIYSL